MVPACSWSPEDYYRASRHANRAWLATQPQQVLPGVLEAADSRTTSLVESAASSASINRLPCPVDALDNSAGVADGCVENAPTPGDIQHPGGLQPTREETC